MSTPTSPSTPRGASLMGDLRKLLAFGSGVGIEVGAADLEVVVTRLRAGRVAVPGRLVIPRYAERPAAEWGHEYSAFLKSLGAGYLSATVLLPRHDLVVRQVALPGVASKDVESAIRFQLDTLHPYGDEEIWWGWSPLTYGFVLLGMARRSVISRYVELFNAAGISVSSFTFTAAALHAAIRVAGRPPNGFLALGQPLAGTVEAYGESASRPVFSADLTWIRNAPPCWRFPSCGCRPRRHPCRSSRCFPNRESTR